MFLIPCIIEIKNRREKLKLSKQRLALQAGLPSNAVYRIESGETKKINHLRAREIARVLGCKVEDICRLPERSA